LIFFQPPPPPLPSLPFPTEDGGGGRAVRKLTAQTTKSARGEATTDKQGGRPAARRLPCGVCCAPRPSPQPPAAERPRTLTAHTLTGFAGWRLRCGYRYTGHDKDNRYIIKDFLRIDTRGAHCFL
jgi:hypothetical protein